MKFTIYKKMMFGFGVIITVMMLANAYILLELGTVSNGIKITLSSHVRIIDLAKKLQIILDDENAYAQKYLISSDKTYFNMFSESTRMYDQGMRSVQNMESDETGRSLINKIRITHDSILTSIKEAGDIVRLEKEELNVELMDYYEIMRHHLDHLIEHNQSTISNSMAEFESTASRSARVSLLITICTLLSAIVMAFLIARTITKPVGKLIQRTGEIAEGRFVPISVSSNDEIALLADAVNEMSSKLNKINELRAEMMQQISHELQNPLQIILSAHDILATEAFGTLNEKQLMYLDSISQAINMLSAFSNQYLEIAKIDAGMTEYQLRPMELAIIIQPLVEEAKIIASNKKVSLDFSVQGDVPKVMVDPDKIEIVIRNLIGNAVKYTQSGGKVNVSIQPSHIGAKVTITDNGIGIASEELPKIFNRFYRVRNDSKAGATGKGLGLALVKALTEGQGGQVFAKSTVNVGSTFIVELQSASKKYPKVHFLTPAEA